MMMRYGYEYGDAMWGGGYDLLCLITWLVILVDLVLVGMWLWKQIKK